VALIFHGQDGPVDGFERGGFLGGKDVVVMFDKLLQFLGMEPFAPAFRAGLNLNTAGFNLGEG
jgi:hypothetical protein